MSYSNETFSRAKRELDLRHSRALSERDARIERVETEVPEIKAINEQLANTCVNLSKLILRHDGNISDEIERIKEANLHAQKMSDDILRARGLDKDYFRPKFVCAECSDTGYVNGRRCRCFSRLLEKYAFEELSANSRMKLCGFETFDLNYYKASGDETYTQMKNIYEYCVSYAKNFSVDSKSIFMLGKTGLGKTHLSLAITKEVIIKGYSAAYDSIVNFLREIEKEHFGRSDKDTLSLLLDVDLLVLDDLGSEFDSAFYSSTVYNIINSRLNKGLPTGISTNLSPQEMQKKYDDRIISRLFAMYDYLKFSGSDIRQQKKING